ncbi:MAG TPA: hypothetical protein VMU59_14475 [Caulobacteraceae bacterium]|nr:hypothetical protein [Caulobacteraceae bacterium]
MSPGLLFFGPVVLMANSETNRFAAFASIVASSIFLSSCFYVPTHVFKYKLDVGVESGGQLHVGSGVAEVHVEKLIGPAIDGNGQLDLFVKGEAIPIDLGNGAEVVVLTVGGANGGQHRNFPGAWGLTPIVAIAHAAGLPANDADMAGDVERLRGTWDLPDSSMPDIVLASQRADPQILALDVRNADSLKVAGIDAVSMRISIVKDADVTHGIKEKMPWLYEIMTNSTRSLRYGNNFFNKYEFLGAD